MIMLRVMPRGVAIWDSIGDSPGICTKNDDVA
jgi:hypothetical protein